jgi:hypothetical protein
VCAFSGGGGGGGVFFGLKKGCFFVGGGVGEKVAEGFFLETTVNI